MIAIYDKPLISQDKYAWLVTSKGSDPIDIRNVAITDGGILKVEATRKPGPVKIVNVWNAAANGNYFMLLWPYGDNSKQTAVPVLVWDQSKCTHDLRQGPYEALARFKVDNCHIIGGRYRAFLKKDGKPNKQILQIRHGKQYLIEGATFLDGWNDHGQQKVAGQGYVKSQHVGVVTYDSCNFGRWTAGHKLWDRQPGVDKIILAGKCIDPDGKRLKNGERYS